jgi:hypothetical protein
MQTTYLGRVAPGMTVYDMAGEKIGTIARVFRYTDPTGHAGGAVSSSARTTPDEVMEVKTGFFGLGHHFYIPTDAIDDGLESSIFLSKPREEFERLGWDEKPAEP